MSEIKFPIFNFSKFNSHHLRHISRFIYVINKVITFHGGFYVTKRVCSSCQSDMIEDCSVKVQYEGEGIKILKKNGFFSYTSSIAKAAVCPNCGNVSLYVDDFEKFKD